MRSISKILIFYVTVSGGQVASACILCSGSQKVALTGPMRLGFYHWLAKFSSVATVPVGGQPGTVLSSGDLSSRQLHVMVQQKNCFMAHPPFYKAFFLNQAHPEQYAIVSLESTD